jgi:hypothetical protein
MPVESALITQFLAFTMLYYVDTRAAYRGWTPPWYNTYRFVLTFIVGVSIVVSLIGRGEVANRVNAQPGGTNRITALKKATLLGEEDEQKYIQHKEVEEDEAEEDNGVSGEEEESDESGKDEERKDGKDSGKKEGKTDDDAASNDEGKDNDAKDDKKD